MELNDFDCRCLAGEEGEAPRFAMNLLRRVGEAAGADRFIDISRCHLVGAYDIGPGNRALLDRLVAWGARVRVPTTLNASSACLSSGAPGDPEAQAGARGMVERYLSLGCQPTLTCAPYQSADVPGFGECIAWAESNAVVYANSVLGARTNHTVQFLDLAAALTGRMPRTGLYREARRRPTVDVEASVLRDEGVRCQGGFALLGLWIGGWTSRKDVPLIRGLPEDTSKDELRTLGAAAASAGGLAMFHAEGLTPESPGARSRAADRLLPHRKVTREILETVAGRFSAPEGTPLDAVCLGTPHYSLAELRRLAELLGQAPGALRIPIIVTLSRATLAQAATEGLDAALEARGVTLVTDTCTYYGSVISFRGGAVMTDSAKWAWYGGGNLGVRPVLAGLEACVASALVGCVSGPMVHLP